MCIHYLLDMSLIVRRLSACGAMKTFSSDFYLQSRMGAIYPRLSLKDEIPMFDSLEEWQSHKSTKIDICALMCLHLISRDDAPRMIFKDGQVIFPKVAIPLPGEEVSQDTKVLIYLEFPSFGPLVRRVCILDLPLSPSAEPTQVFDLYKIRHLFIDGRSTYDQRAKAIKTFNEDPTIRVLFFSSVGATGLNLTVARVVIFLVCFFYSIFSRKF
jgi:hypothetical protein